MADLARASPRGPCKQPGQPGLYVSPHLPPEMMRTSRWCVSQFHLQRLLASGKSSELHSAIDSQSGVPVALKMYHKKKLSAINKVQVTREIALQTQLHHENIVNLYAAFEDDKTVYLVQELASGGDLFQKVRESPGRRLPEQQLIVDVMRPLLSALCYLHERGIIHRDIKPENIVLDAHSVIKLADFGLAINSRDERPVTRAGTLDYMAPEVLICPDKDRPMENKDQEHLVYAEQVDIWAAGVLAWELLVGKPPFEQSNSRMAFEQILSMEPDFPDWMSANARSFIQAALCKDARSRPTARQLLLHRWLQPGARRRSRTVTQPVVGSGMGNFAEPCSLSECSSPPRPAARVSPSPSSDSQTPHSRAPLPERSSPVRRPPSGVLSDDSALASPPSVHSAGRYVARSPLPRPGDLASDRLALCRLGPGDDRTPLTDPSDEILPQASKYSALFSKLWGGNGAKADAAVVDAAMHSRASKLPLANGLREKSMHNMAARDKSVMPREKSVPVMASRDRSPHPSALAPREKSIIPSAGASPLRDRGALKEALAARERSVIMAKQRDPLINLGTGLRSPTLESASNLRPAQAY